VQGSSLISQIFSPKVPSTTDDGYSSPKSEKETDDEDNDDRSLKTSDYQHSDSKKPSKQRNLYKVQQCEIFIFKCVNTHLKINISHCCTLYKLVVFVVFCIFCYF